MPHVHPYVALEQLRADCIKFAAGQAESIAAAFCPYTFSAQLDGRVEEAIRDLAQGLHDVVADVMFEAVREVVGDDGPDPLGKYPSWGNDAVEAYRTDPVRIARARLRAHLNRQATGREIDAAARTASTPDLTAALAAHQGA